MRVFSAFTVKPSAATIDRHKLHELGDLGRVIAREGQVIGIARVGKTMLAGQPRQAVVETQQDGVAETGAGRCALHTNTRAGRHVIELAFSRHRLARRLGHQHCECCRHGIAVSERNQEPANTAKVDGRKAVLDVEVQHHGLAHVRGGIGGNRAALDETMRLFALSAAWTQAAD